MALPSTVEFTVIDAFTDTPFAGNPAAVCLLAEPPPEAWMQAVAAEMNLSETAYLVPVGEGRWSLRWFTPTIEVDLCGHATLASARYLADAGALAAGPVAAGSVATTGAVARFDTRSGELIARVVGDRIVLDLPATEARRADAPPGLLAALGVEPTEVVSTGCTDTWAVVELTTPRAVVDLEPDASALGSVPILTTVVTAPGGRDGAAITSRVFGPAVGIDEDPVTGAAHTLLGPWWAPRVGATFLAHQASARGGWVEVAVLGARVELGGHAVPVAWGRVLGPT